MVGGRIILILLHKKEGIYLRVVTLPLRVARTEVSIGKLFGKNLERPQVNGDHPLIGDIMKKYFKTALYFLGFFNGFLFGYFIAFYLVFNYFMPTLEVRIG